MNSADVDLFFSRLAERTPEPKTELEFTNAFTLLVAVVLSAQATDAGVNKATRALFERVRTPAEMLDLGEEGLRGYVKSIGLFNTKARHILELSDILIREHGGEVPEDRKALEALPGVGRKTAAVVLNVAFGHPTIPVDTHIFRVANRTGLAPGHNAAAVEDLLEALVPERWKPHAHHWLILHGRYVCKARGPNCRGCVVEDLCTFPDKSC